MACWSDRAGIGMPASSRRDRDPVVPQIGVQKADAYDYSAIAASKSRAREIGDICTGICTLLPLNGHRARSTGITPAVGQPEPS